VLAFSADGRWLATSSGDHIQIVETATWRPVVIPVRHVLSLSFDPGGSRIATATGDGGAAIWSLPGGALVRHLREAGEPIEQIAWSPDGRLIATASRDGAERVWRAASGEVMSRGNQLHGSISSIEFDSSSSLVLAAGKGVVVSDATQGVQLIAFEFEASQRAAHFSPTVQRIAGVSRDGTARVWDASLPYRRWSVAPIADSCDTFGGAEPDRRYLPIACPGYPTRVWDTARDQLLAELPSVSAPAGDFARALPTVSSGGTRAAIARSSVAELYELPGGRLLHTITHRAAVSALAFGPGGELASGDVAGGVIVTRGDREERIIAPAAGGVDAIAILAGGWLVVADATHHLRVLDPSNVVMADLKLPERVGLLRPSLDGRRLVTMTSSAIPSQSGSIGPAQLWDIESRRLVASMAGHRGRTVAARWISDDEILTAGADGTVRRWDGRTGEERKVYRVGGRFLVDATTGPGGLVVAGDGNGALHFWDAQSGDRLWTLSAHPSYVAGLHFEGGELVTRGFGGDVSRWRLSPATKVIEEAVGRGIVGP
jgi:WD40 repeat protein